MKRREVMLQLASSAFFLPFVVSPAFAETSIVASEAFRVYTDEANKFEISIPQGKKNYIKTQILSDDHNMIS